MVRASDIGASRPGSIPGLQLIIHFFFLFYSFIMLNYFLQVLAVRRIFSLVDMPTNTKFSNCPYVFKIGVVQK